MSSVSINETNTEITYSVSENTSLTEPQSGKIVLTFSRDGEQNVVSEISVSQSAAGKTKHTVKFTPTYSNKTFGVTISGESSGITATYSNTYSNANQMTGGNSCTLTITGLAGSEIKGATVNAKSNKSAGTGSLTLKTGETEIASYSWSSAIGGTYTDFALDVTSTTIAKLGKGQTVNMEVLGKICKALKVNVGDIVDYLPDKE